MYPDGEIDPGNVWARALRGLSMSDIRRGLNALVDKRIEWPPSAIEFLKLCEQCDDDLGVPGAGLAVSLFLKQLSMAPHARNWSDIHPAVYWCYKQIGSFDCANHSQDKLAARFKDLWPQAVDLAKSGKLQVPQENRIESTTGTITPGIAESEIQKIKGIFND